MVGCGSWLHCSGPWSMKVATWRGSSPLLTLSATWQTRRFGNTVRSQTRSQISRLRPAGASINGTERPNQDVPTSLCFILRMESTSPIFFCILRQSRNRHSISSVFKYCRTTSQRLGRTAYTQHFRETSCMPQHGHSLRTVYPEISGWWIVASGCVDGC